MYLGAEHIVNRYDAEDPNVDPDERRLDRQWRLTFNNTARLSGAWALEMQVQYTDVDSNLPNFEFTNTSVTLGLSTRF